MPQHAPMIAESASSGQALDAARRRRRAPGGRQRMRTSVFLLSSTSRCSSSPRARIACSSALEPLSIHRSITETVEISVVGSPGVLSSARLVVSSAPRSPTSTTSPGSCRRSLRGTSVQPTSPSGTRRPKCVRIEIHSPTTCRASTLLCTATRGCSTEASTSQSARVQTCGTHRSACGRPICKPAMRAAHDGRIATRWSSCILRWEAAGERAGPQPSEQSTPASSAAVPTSCSISYFFSLGGTQMEPMIAWSAWRFSA